MAWTFGVTHSYPFKGLTIQVSQAFEGATEEKVGFHRPEVAFFVCLTVGMAYFMRFPFKAVVPCECYRSREDIQVES